MSAKGPKFSIVERRFWTSGSVRKLTRGVPNGREFFLYLLTCDAQTAFPGLFVLKLGEAADDLVWSIDDVRRCLEECVAAELVKYDPTTRVVFLPSKPRKHAHGLTPNHVTGWRNALRELPDCDLVREAVEVAEHAIADAARGQKEPGKIRTLVENLRRKGPVKGSTKPLPKGSTKGLQSADEGSAEPFACMDRLTDQERRDQRGDRAHLARSADPISNGVDQSRDTGQGIVVPGDVTRGLRVVEGGKSR